MKKNIGFFVVLLSSCFVPFAFNIAFATAGEEMVFTFRSSESDHDNRYDYDNALLKLALDSTLETDGPYKLVASPVMNFIRAQKAVQNDNYPNFFIKLSYEEAHELEGMAFVPFPIDRGIVGYRVCFVSSESKEKLHNIENLGQLKKLLHGQGKGWSDTAILRHNGFQVKEVAKYESLFEMVSRGRFDLFCRGTNELLSEIENHKHIDGLEYDTSMALVYPLPRFLYTSKKNVKALDRVRRGIMIAYNNGSLQKIWREEYQRNIDFVDLKNRKIFRIENPLVETLDFNYQQFFYDPINN